MTDKTCKDLENLLVDYADGVLPDPQSREIDDHLAHCPQCRALLAALRQSVALTSTVWNESYQDVANLKPSDVLPQRRGRSASLFWAVAAAIALAIAAPPLWRILTLPAPGPAQPAEAPIEHLIAATPTLTPEEVSRSVSAAGISTALLASVDWLAEQPANRDIARRQYEFITRMYPGTEIAQHATRRLSSLDKETVQ